MLSNMQHWQVEPDEISYSAALSACEKPLQWQQALGILSAMQRLQRLEPNAINACEKGEQWQHEDAFGDAALQVTRSLSTQPYFWSLISSARRSSSWPYLRYVINFNAAIMQRLQEGQAAGGEQWRPAKHIRSIYKTCTKHVQRIQNK